MPISALNPNWNRWIFASTGVYFRQYFVALVPVMKFHVENEIEDAQGDYAELRMSGPAWEKPTKSIWRGEIVLNFLVHCIKDEKDYHKIYRMVGKVEASIPMCYPIFKYGDEVDDDRTMTIGDTQLIRRNADKDIVTIHYGQVVDDIPELQSTIEAHYRIDLED